MGENIKSEFQRQKEIIRPKIILWFKRIYVIAFNIYAFFWFYREVFIRQSSDWEGYLLWIFATAGMLYFSLDNKDLIILKEQPKTPPSESARRAIKL